MLENTIKKYKNKSFLIAYSGGLDSTVLLYKMIKIKKYLSHIKIRAIHINHNLTLLSEQWTEHCKNICNINNIPLIITTININNKTNNLEEQLRIQRYNIIYKNLYHNEILLTGHHMNDQCETFILSLKRGSGPNGLSSMSYETVFGKTKIIRPFLTKTKKDLELWAINNNINWIEDASNTNINHDRNFIRHNLLPILEKRWPFFIKNCFRTTQICQQEKIVLNHFVHKKIHKFLNYDNSLNIKTFKNIQKEICISFIRHWIALNKLKMPSYNNIQSIYYQMIFSRIDALPKFVLHTNEIRRYKNCLYIIKTQPNVKNTILLWHKKNKKLILPNNLGCLKQNIQGISLPAPKKDELINIRFQYEGNILILDRHKKRKIKKIWQEKNIPPWLRNQIPLLFYNNIFISALGVFVINLKNKNQEIWNVSWYNNVQYISKNSFIFF